jgi:hypothetical protein
LVSSEKHGRRHFVEELKEKGLVYSLSTTS